MCERSQEWKHSFLFVCFPKEVCENTRQSTCTQVWAGAADLFLETGKLLLKHKIKTTGVWALLFKMFICQLSQFVCPLLPSCVAIMMDEFLGYWLHACCD